MLGKLARLEALPASFVLMEFVEGVEMGVGAYFDGDKFLLPACLDWEHKRFFPGDLGELTGEMGTVVTYERSRGFFERTLERMEPLLREHGHCGYVNLNTIVNEPGSGRSNSPAASATPASRSSRRCRRRHGKIVHGHGQPIDKPICNASGILRRNCPHRAAVSLPAATGGGAGGTSVLFDGELTEADRTNLHYCELGLENGELVTSGMYGWAMVVTGVGDSIASAQQRANSLADRVLIPNVRYRRDIGDRLMAGDYARVEKLCLLDVTSYAR